MDIRTIAWLTGFFCTLLWLSFAFMVAFPAETLSFDFARLAGVFLDGSEPEGVAFERIFIPLLLAVDIVISVLLGHFRPSQRGILISLLALLVYVVAAGIAPTYSDSHTAKSHAALFFVAFSCLSVMRLATFLSPRSFALWKAPEATSGSGDRG